MRDQSTRRISTLALAAAPFLVLFAAEASHADNFQSVAYDPATDELVIGVVYRGTNPDHQFSLKWGPCVDRGDNQHEIVAELLDNQFQDAARKDYRKTVRMSLAAMDCRPAALTLRSAPRFYYTLTIPQRAANAPRR
ncbi:MAG TPA: hypothetical protein VGN30_21595 [Steroidobacteraceae bacterium]|jgi:hypothetical protein